MANLLQLEDFDAPAAAPVVAPEEPVTDTPAYAVGFADGLAAARDAQKSVDKALVETLGDLAFGFAEARAALLAEMAPLFEALAAQFLPRILDEAFHVRLTDSLIGLASVHMNAPVRLIVHPDQVDAVARLLPHVPGLKIDLHQDPAVGAHGALISQGRSEHILDLDELTAEIQNTFSALFATTQPAQEPCDDG